ncbi:hypothetical protein HA402_008459 [Bradysia odoriphaga]|nr:hypothetical protein HA402_008459 [Bradysia odoriphaga]
MGSSTVVFMGLNKINGVDMWGMISQYDGCAFRAVPTNLKTDQYVSFLDDVILPMWKNNKDLVFMHVEPYYISIRQIYEIRPHDGNKSQSTVRYLGAEIKELMTVDDRRAELTGADETTIVYNQVTAAEFALEQCQQSFLDIFQNTRVVTPPRIDQFLDVMLVEPDETSMAADQSMESMAPTMASDTEMVSVESGESVVSGSDFVPEFAQLAANMVIEDFQIARFKGYKQLFVLLNQENLYFSAEGVPIACRENDQKMSSVPVCEYDWSKHKISRNARKQLIKRTLTPLRRETLRIGESKEGCSNNCFSVEHVLI